MKKFKLYRSPGNLDKDVKKHELVAVEFGKNIEEVTEDLIKAVEDDLASSPEYKGCRTGAYAPTFVQAHRKVTRYHYEILGIVYPKCASENILIDFGIIEEECSEWDA